MGIGAEILSAGSGLISGAQGSLTSALKGVDADDPTALIGLSVKAFMFTNTVSSVSGTISSVSSATQSAAGKIGQ